jgi:hypothetical protein
MAGKPHPNMFEYLLLVDEHFWPMWMMWGKDGEMDATGMHKPGKRGKYHLPKKMTELVVAVVDYLDSLDGPKVSRLRTLIRTERVLVMDSRFPTLEGLAYCRARGLHVIASCHGQRIPWNRLGPLKGGLTKGEYTVLYNSSRSAILVVRKIKTKKAMYLYATCGSMILEEREARRRKGITCTYVTKAPQLFKTYADQSQKVDIVNKMVNTYSSKRRTNNEGYLKFLFILNLDLLRARILYKWGREEQLRQLQFREQLLKQIYDRYGSPPDHGADTRCTRAYQRGLQLLCADMRCPTKTTIYCSQHDLYVCALCVCKDIPKELLRKRRGTK